MIKSTVFGMILSLGTLFSSIALAKPVIVDDVKGFDRCEDDAYMPCNGRALTVVNTSKKAQKVKIACAGLNVEDEAVIPAKGRLTFDLGQGNTNIVEGQCFVVPSLSEALR